MRLTFHPATWRASIPRVSCLGALATLVVLAAGCPNVPVIVVQPQSQTVETGKTATFSCVALGAWPLSYVWKKDGEELVAAQLASYTTPPANALYAGQYTCEVSNANGTTVSKAATLTVKPSTTSPEYQSGFAEGYANDEWYWKGFDDSLGTLADTSVLYRADTIPDPESPDHDRGYYDGIWYAYNDGYYVAYDYAFTIGFSEGYDAAFYWDYLGFLQRDTHTEYADGGWADGYNDGFSEGRVFGAYDYMSGWALDWMDAMADYWSGTDLSFDEIGVGTGSDGPVKQYVYGTDPTDDKAGSGRARASKAHSVSYRTLTSTESAKFNKTPTTAVRSEHKLTLTTTWLQRINAYLDTID